MEAYVIRFAFIVRCDHRMPDWDAQCEGAILQPFTVNVFA